ncbi:hypothetical protein [Brumimicrobium oceani]|uniref:Cytochrome C n=1 Tax=Brumimicrobium oceani TaxID=2100725 RepID=A0A2U2XFR9_9FLAO|nr:hypothetical protein [Brumimicrobium oceani]PWH86648.1 hypothetical protein DIT68_05290 [Brumimicrobium oceani]
MKKLLPIFLTVSVLLNLGLVYFFFIKGDTVQAEDNRTAIAVSPDNRDFVLAEMRLFLESVQQINQGIIEEDAGKVAEAGVQSGGSAVDHAPPGLVKSLPMAFKTLGFSTHQIFDDIAESAQSDFKPKKSREQLDLLLKNCVACHRNYKLETKLK